MKYVMYNPSVKMWIAEGAGSWGRLTSNPDEAMKMPYGEWLVKCNYRAFHGKNHYTLLPSSEFEQL